MGCKIGRELADNLTKEGCIAPLEGFNSLKDAATFAECYASVVETGTAWNQIERVYRGSNDFFYFEINEDVNAGDTSRDFNVFHYLETGLEGIVDTGHLNPITAKTILGNGKGVPERAPMFPGDFQRRGTYLGDKVAQRFQKKETVVPTQREPEQVYNKPTINSPRTTTSSILNLHNITLGGVITVREGTDITLGRDKSVVDYVLIDNIRTVSRKHCHISSRDGNFYVQDLGSSNGTFVDGYRLSIGESKMLNNGSLLEIGGVKMTVEIK